MEELSSSSAASAMERIFSVAAEEGASDIHIEPGPRFVMVRFRIDGQLHYRFRLNSSMAAPLAVRCKVLGKMDVAETRIPQDGSCSLSLEGRDFDIRLSSLPSSWGETLVLRLLSSTVPFIEQNDLGMLPVQEETFLQCLKKKSGMVLTTGPTGSGKTSTLYAALKLLNTPEISIISIEDPIEYRIPGMTQMMVNEKAGLTFASGLRALVRQDPDIIMIGEIRDRETAEIAVHAALTGHLVLSTLHTNNACQAPLRLMDMGIPSYLLSASLSLILSQRLTRKLCTACRTVGKLEESSRETALFGQKRAGQTIYHAAGCNQCHHTGYIGRTGLFELLEVTDLVAEAIHDGAAPSQLSQLMKDQGQPSLSDSACFAMDAGLIPPEEAELYLT